MKLRRLMLAVAFAAISVAAHAQQSGVGPTPPAGAAPPYTPLAGCVYMPNGVGLSGYVGPMGLTCGSNGGLNVNVLTGGGGGGGGGTGAITSPIGSNTKAQSVSVTYATDQLLPAFATAPTIANTAFGITGALPAGTNTIGAVTQASGPWAVSWTGQTVAATESGAWSVAVTNFPATQPVSNAGTFSVQNTAATPAGANSIGTVGLNAGTNAIGSVTNTAFGVTGPLPAGTNNIGIVTNNPSTGATLTTSQPSVTTAAAALTFSGTVHREIYNPAASTASIFIGASGVTTSTGFEVPPGASYDLSRFSGSVFAVAASSQTVRLISY